MAAGSRAHGGDPGDACCLGSLHATPPRAHPELRVNGLCSLSQAVLVECSLSCVFTDGGKFWCELIQPAQFILKCVVVLHEIVTEPGMVAQPCLGG